MLDKPYDRLAGWILILPLIAITFFQKFGFQIGPGEVPISAPIIWGLVALGFLSGRLELHKKRLVFYCITMAILILTQLIGGYDFSEPSLALMVMIHSPYIFSFKQGMIQPGAELEFLQKTMVVISLVGIAQYFLQFVIGPEWAFLIDHKFPKEIVLQNYNSLNETSGPGQAYKSNGFFFMEPSFFSQMLALSIIIEVVFFRNIKRLVLFVLALAVTFSGTGVLLLLILIPFYLLLQKRFIILFSLLAILFTAPFWAPYVGLKETVGRASEITHEGSSGFARFISPAISVNEILFPSGTKTILVGLGAGSMPRMIDGYFDYEAASSTWAKIIFEYGIVGGFAYFLFIGYIFFSGRKNIYLSVALFLFFLLLAEYILSPVAHGLILVLLLWGEKIPEAGERRDIAMEKQEG